MTKTPEASAWLAAEMREQDARYAQIIADMDAIEGKREEWIGEFLDRVEGRGFHWHSDQLQKVPADRMAAIRARRPARTSVVY